MTPTSPAMAKSTRFRLSIFLELFLDAFLLLLFIAQAFVGGCLLIYGHLPLPSEWGNRLIAEQLPKGLILQIDEFRLRPGGSIELVGIDLRAEGIQQSLLKAKAAEVELRWEFHFELPQLESLILSGGTVYIPSVYSPDGYQRPLLQRIAFRLIPGEPTWEVDRFAALHDSIRLRGALQIPYKKGSTGDLEIGKALNAFYTRVAKLSQQTERIRYFKTPTIAFKLAVLDDETEQIDLRISSRALEHPEATAELVELSGSVRLKGLEFTPTSPPRFSASHIEVPRYEFAAESIRAAVAPDKLNGLLNGDWPQIQIAARSIDITGYNLDAPILAVDPSAFPSVQFQGATSSLNGAIQLSGLVNAELWNGHVHARGSVDLVNLLPPDTRKKLPKIAFDTTPHYDLNLDFSPGFALDRAELKAQVNDLQIEGLEVNHINAHASYEAGLYAIDDLYIRRANQWLDLKFSLDSESKDYRVTLTGSAVPYDYNALLPRWWGAIFRDFDFSQSTYSLGDFIIYGNLERKAADLYYGRATAQGVAYKGVHLDTGELIVRGRGPYTELHELEATSGQGWASGDIAFTSKLDEVKGPASVRLNMEAKLSLDDASKLFGGDIAKIIAEFKTDSRPVTRLKGAIFNSAYPQYAGKSYFDLSAACADPIVYKGVPLDYLDFDLFGRSDVTHLRNLQLGYAGGKGEAMIDVFTPKEAANSVRYQLTLRDAAQDQAVNSLPQVDGFGDISNGLKTADNADITPNELEEGRIDLTIRGEGAIDDPLKHTGYGRFEIRNDRLGTIQLLGPLSRVLQTTQLNFTSFNLNRMTGDFSYQNEVVSFDPLHIDGARTHIEAPGILRLSDQSLDMRVSASLFRNVGNPDSNLRKIGQIISKPLPNLLQFELTGTVTDQKFRSLYDPRNFIPRF